MNNPFTIKHNHPEAKVINHNTVPAESFNIFNTLNSTEKMQWNTAMCLKTVTAMSEFEYVKCRIFEAKGRRVDSFPDQHLINDA